MKERSDGYQEFYVAFLDIPGFKNLVSDDSIGGFDSVNKIFDLLFKCTVTIIKEG